jgi:lipoprotein-releasing system permease protein
MKSRDIMSMFMFQGITIAMAGSIAGCSLGFLLCLLQDKFEIIRLKDRMYFLDSLPIHFELWHYGVVLGASLVLAFFATLLPSFAALRVSTLRAIKFK